MTTEAKPSSGLPRTVVTSWNADYVEDLYRQWLDDPSSLGESWQMFFRGFELAMCPRNCVAAGKAAKQSQVASLAYAYRSLGHLMARIDPLNEPPASLPELELSEFGLTEADEGEVFDTGHLYGPKRATLGEIVGILRETYCGSIGVEYLHIQDRKIRRWLQARMEPIRNKPQYDREKKSAILEKLIDAELFEAFLHTRFPGQKRFSLEGSETLIAALHELVEVSPEFGVEEIVLGMTHRGRLNVLANILDKSYGMIFREFEANALPDSYGGDGDVKYHKGFCSTHRNRLGQRTLLDLTANPSHLEAVDPVVLGKARARQHRLGDAEHRKRVVPVLIHGDAAFAGQGLVGETLNLSQLKGYRTGGTVHFIVNNQIGFTTDPSESRSFAYSTEPAKVVEAPIFHVNGDDPEATVFATELALEFRQQFGRDVVVDMLCYRRHGHNESDEPSFTQPLLYRKIEKHPSARNIYRQKLVDEGSITAQDSETLESEFGKKLQAHFEGQEKPREADSCGNQKDSDAPYSHDPVRTGVERGTLIEIARAINSVPPGFRLHPKIARTLPARLESVEGNGSVDWGHAEALAFGSLLLEGHPVRLSGQDSIRGTFSHRHCGWQDTETAELYMPLNHIRSGQSKFCAYNSPLSEAAVLGFDYGYSLIEPGMLVLWEAQFGDFANGAQVIIDQFIVSAQAKWQRMSGLVMLLPHGYEGQGPEHSSAHLERYLLACACQNIAVCYPSTPAQYFHMLRRQINRPFRRPLVVMTPKSLLRHRMAVSLAEEFASGCFREILDDPNPPAKAKRLVLCSGKIYYELSAFRESRGVSDTALVRIEQLYPFHEAMMREIAARYEDAAEVVWCQEEPKNRGAWNHMHPWLRNLFPGRGLRYVGRDYAASAATGSLKIHKKEQEGIVERAVSGDESPCETTILPEGTSCK